MVRCVDKPKSSKLLLGEGVRMSMSTNFKNRDPILISRVMARRADKPKSMCTSTKSENIILTPFSLSPNSIAAEYIPY